MNRPATRGPSVVEIELDLPRLVFAGFLLLIALAGAFFLGRSTAEPDGAAAARAARTDGAAPSAEVDVSGGAGVFDAVDEGARDAARQVERETALAGGWLVDLGTVRSRAEAERIAGAVKKIGLPQLVAGEDGGGFRVATGPFRDRAAAEEAARRVEGALGRRGAVRPPAGG